LREKKVMSKKAVLAVALLLMAPCSLWAADPEVEELKKRVEELEKRLEWRVVTDEPGHKKIHPAHSLYGLSVGGSVTITAHGASGVKGSTPSGEAAISADLAIESPVGDRGRAVAVFDFQKGAGMQGLPAFFTAPNSNPNGYNADIESFDDTSLHATQAYYEHELDGGLTVTFGQLDLTGFFDANEYANNERTQFLANVFVNNPVIEWGGTDNFYGPGARLSWAASDTVGVTIGAFEGDGDYVDTFDSPFLMAELDLALSPMGRGGNYRIYYWQRNKRTAADQPNLADPADAVLINARNSGIGVSIDQLLTETIGIWLRAGVQREKVAQFDKAISGGVDISGELLGRANDQIGIAYSATFIGDGYEDYIRVADPSFDPGTEHYVEAYYSYAVSHSAAEQGFHISPDLQYVVNPGGNKGAGDMFIYGIRLQSFF